MRTALYFPHTEVRSRKIIQTALLLWDNLEYIVPYSSYRPSYKSLQIAEAMEIMGVPRTPTDEEKGRLHAWVEDLIRGGAPETFRYSPRSGTQDKAYEMWPQKLAGDTWRLLRKHKLTGDRLDNHDYPMSQATGLSVMAILADVLAGKTMARITDRGLAYATIANVAKVTADAEESMRVVPLTFKAIEVDRLPIDRLIAFRRREARESGTGYRRLREKYREAIEKHIEHIATVAPNSRDRDELDQAFQTDMEDDLCDLKQELGFARREAWLTKEFLTLAVAGGALLSAAAGIPDIPMPEVVTGTGGVALLGGVLGTGNRLARARRDILRTHPMAYLYEIGA
jgi:hypothetical protein